MHLTFPLTRYPRTVVSGEGPSTALIGDNTRLFISHQLTVLTDKNFNL